MGHFTWATNCRKSCPNVRNHPNFNHTGEKTQENKTVKDCQILVKKRRFDLKSIETLQSTVSSYPYNRDWCLAFTWKCLYEAAALKQGWTILDCVASFEWRNYFWALFEAQRVRIESFGPEFRSVFTFSRISAQRPTRKPPNLRSRVRSSLLT